MNRQRTKVWMLRSQVAAVVLLVAGGAIAISPIDFGGNVPKPVYKRPEARRVVDARATDPIDPGLASRLVAVALPQPSEPRPAAPVEDPSKPAEGPKAPPKAVWEYLGGLIGPTSRRAIVTLAGDQRMVKEGETVDGARVNAITSGFIMIERDGAQERIERKGKQERVAAAIVPSLPGSGMALGARGAQAMKHVPQGPSKGSGSAKADRMAEVREKHRQAYIEAMRMNNYAPPDADLLQKFGISDFKPTDQEMAGIMRQIKDELNGPGDGGGVDVHEKPKE